MSRSRLSDIALTALLAMAAVAVLEGVVINDRPETSGYGGDFSQFYAAGTIVAHGEAARLYDQPYFRHLQAWMRQDPLYSLYPPTMALAMAPLARLDYYHALAAWWAIQAVCLVATGAILYRMSPLAQPWRGIMLVALAALLPVWIGVGIGHLSPMLLLVLTAGLALHRKSRGFAAGIVLSLLAVKPQLAAGLGVWMLVRRDVRTIAGLVLGGILQFAVAAATLGPGVWLDYVQALPMIADVTRAYAYSPLIEQSFAGIASNLLYSIGLGAWARIAMKVVYALTAGAAFVALWQVVAAGRKSLVVPPSGGHCRKRRSGDLPPEGGTTNRLKAELRTIANYEYAAGVLFMTIFPPYFLVYDESLLAIPLVMLWATPRWRWGVSLLVTASLPFINLSSKLGFSFIGIVVLATMFALAKTCRQSCLALRESRDSCAERRTTMSAAPEIAAAT